MNRYLVTTVLALAWLWSPNLATCQAQTAEEVVYLPTVESLAQRRTPEWFGGAKLGIFVHWGLYSVPGWAETKVSVEHAQDWRYFYQHNPYAEWYLNTLKIKGSPTYLHHQQQYGDTTDYYDFAPVFDRAAQAWQASDWAKLFAEAGAKYVVLTTKHHDGFRLWPSRVPNPLFARPLNASRNLVGELAGAVRGQGLKFGLYYSGGLDWTFYRSPITNLYPDLFQSKPTSLAYASYAEAHYYELVHQFRPDVLWNDVGFPAKADPLGIFSELFNLNPEAVVNDRWERHPQLADFITPEYKVMDTICARKWETCRGLGYSFGYNQNETDREMLSPDALVDLLIDIVSKNGNLLLNVGPMANGTIPAGQVLRLRELGQWLKTNGVGIYGSRPHVVAAAQLPDGTPLRYTRQEGALYVFLLAKPTGSTIVCPLSVALTPAQQATMQVRLLGEPAQPVAFRYLSTEQALRVTLPPDLPGRYAYTLEVRLGF
jgi:alpha-L-fucosidase